MSDKKIETGIRSKHLIPNLQVSETNRVYMERLRSDSKNRVVYEIDPYVEVYPIGEKVYSLFTQNADDVGDTWLYLIEGLEQAMLIDTGFGIGDLKGLCRKITGGKPLIVVNSHPHPDHSYGNCRFEKIFCHKYSIPDLEMQNAHMWDRFFNEKGENIWLDFDPADIPVFQKYKIIECPDGRVFDLGDHHEIELVHTAGHHPGHLCFLDRKNRMLFAGDVVCSESVHVEGPWPGQAYPEYATVRAYRDGMKKLSYRLNEFDKIYPSHYMYGLKSCVIKNILESCDDILSAFEDEKYEKRNQEERYRKSVKNHGDIVYRGRSRGTISD